MKYAITMGTNSAEIILGGDLSIEELEVVKDTLAKMIDSRIIELKRRMQNQLPITADIDSLYPELSVRARNVLKRNGCNTIGDVLDKTSTDLLRMRNMGRNSYEEIIQRIGRYGSFKEGGESDEDD